LYAAACTVGAALTEGDAEAALSAPLALSEPPLSLPEEQPAAISITGTAAAQTRTR
jgi:hypothetical protein